MSDHKAQGEPTEHKKHKKHVHAAHPEHEHEEGWIVSFADNVLLMMGFFVILLAMNMGPKGSADAAAASESADDRLIDMAIAIREGFNSPVNMDSKDANDLPLIRRIRERKTQGDSSENAPDGEEQSVQNTRPSDWAGDGGFVIFDDKSSLLSEAAKITISQLSEKVADTRWMVEIRGHSSKWETWRDVKKARDLAYQRAWSVGNELTLHGVTWNQIRLVSCGDSDPVVSRAGSADQAQSNQRAEIVVLNETIPPDPYTDATGPTDSPSDGQ